MRGLCLYFLQLSAAEHPVDNRILRRVILARFVKKSQDISWQFMPLPHPFDNSPWLSLTSVHSFLIPLFRLRAHRAH